MPDSIPLIFIFCSDTLFYVCQNIFSVYLHKILGSEEDLEYFVRECGDILGVTNKLPAEPRDAKHILEYIFTQVVEFKKLNQVKI